MVRRLSAFLALLLAASGSATNAATDSAPLSSPQRWDQFRLNDANNAVIPGSMLTSWRIFTGAGFSASPTLAGGVLYIGNNGGRLFAVNPKSGRVLWTYRAAAPLMSNPLVFAGMVVVGEGNQLAYHDPHRDMKREPERLLVGTGANSLIALDASSGKMRWRVPLKGSAMPTPVVVGGVLFQHDGAGFVSAIDPKKGRILYSRDVHNIASMSAPVPVGTRAFADTGVQTNAALSIDAHTGATLWKHVFSKRASGLGDCPAASDGRRMFCNYLVPAGDSPQTELGQPVIQHLYALDQRSGKLLWDVPTQSGLLRKYNEASIPIVDGGIVFSGNSIAPRMNALDASTGRLLWSATLPAPVKGGPVATGGILYFGDLDGHLWALDESTGKVRGCKELGTQFNVGSPIVAGRTLVIGTNTGSIIALPLKSILDSHDP